MERNYQNNELLFEWFGQNLLDSDFSHNINVYLQKKSMVSFKTFSEKIKIIRAPMGSGKTSALIDFLNTIPDTESVLVISCRKTFAVELLNRFKKHNLNDFYLYSDIKDRQIKKRKLIIQVESLHRVSENYDVLILDEIMSIIKQFYSKTMIKIKEVDFKFLTLVKNSTQIVAMDATVNRYVVNFFSLCVPHYKCALLINTYVNECFSERSAFFCPTFLDGNIAFYSVLKEKLESGKNICVFCSTVTSADFMANLIKTDFPEKKILLLTSKQGRCDCIDSWILYNAVIYTSVVTVGLNFEHIHFSAMFAYVQLVKGGPDMVSVFQSIGRVRKLIDNEMFIYFNPALIKKLSTTAPITIPQCHDWTIFEENVMQCSCVDFDSKCISAQKYTSDSTIKQFFRVRHYIEKTTLLSLSDSVYILCLLLQNNAIKVYINNCLFPISKEEFYEFTKLLIQNCHFIEKRKQNQLVNNETDFKDLICSKDTIVNGEFYELGTFQIHKNYITNLNDFKTQFLKAEIDIFMAEKFIISLRSEINRFVFINAVLQKCLSTNMGQEQIKQILKNHIQTVTLPENYECSKYFLLNDISGVHERGMLIDVALLAESIRVDLKIQSCTDIETDICEDAILLCAARKSTEILRILQIVFTTHVQLFERYNTHTLYLYNKLKGMQFNKMHLSIEKFSITILRMFFKCAFNMNLVKSKPRYIIGKPFRRLTKRELETLLDTWNIPRTNLKTYKELRKALTDASRKKNKKKIYKLQGYNISSHLRETFFNLQNGNAWLCLSPEPLLHI
ncbi:DNA replication origin-binding helicase [macacine betaherpesvirus 9]|uniref:Replication origin-binding protein n=1 Tax=macacine betaherpesvirus 9 TaxID=2560568 RepID=A0A191S3S9_9BETA|nr:DNA replication origin-binding helicase [macacine betaherpesvirus 9]ANC96528.1 DNA replication origin-binding helicase [macacine betaherpesvirus 9]